jgi:protein kinase-like protein/PEGA domain-containing protein
VAEEVRSTSRSVAPGAITALLREAFRSPPVAGGISGFQPGRLIGRFELVRKLGRGGFGVIFEALDRTLGRAVAFKAVRMVGDVDMSAEMLLREAEAAAQLSHPNIVTLHDVGQCEHGPYLVMELLRGCTLGERLEDGAIPAREAVRIAIEVARGVAHAHARGVVHRDLKPGNVFLCDDGQVKVLDFGMARVFGRPKLDGGTIAYMAPEQWRGGLEDERTDVFAMGVVLHEMLSGKRPFRDAAALASSEEAPRLELREGGALAELVGRMLAKDAAARPRDGREVLAALAALDQELGARPIADAAVASRRRRARRVPVLVASSMMVVAAVVLAVPLGRHASGRPAPAVPLAVAAPPATEGAGAERPSPPAPPPPVARATRREAAPQNAGSPGRRANPARPGGSVRYCRGSIESIPTPLPATGDGVLTVLADPFGEVFVNGRPYGETPGECLVSAGTYTVRAVHSRYGTLEARVRVGPGARTRWTADFLRER